MNIVTKLKRIFFYEKNTAASCKPAKNTSEAKELSIEELYPNMTYDEIWIAILEKDEDALTLEELEFKLGMTLYNEQLNGRAHAIRELLNNSYQILNDEGGNPHKEIINFTLLYFQKFNAEKPDEVHKLLSSSFPLMHRFIYRQISKQQNTIAIDNNFDAQKAYDEFMDFCKNVFLSLHPEKDKRDRQIKRHFKILSNGLIDFIENEKHTRPIHSAE